MVWGGGGGRYVTNVCMYAALFRLYSGTITQTARSRESVPMGQVHTHRHVRISATIQPRLPNKLPQTLLALKKKRT